MKIQFGESKITQGGMALVLGIDTTLGPGAAITRICWFRLIYDRHRGN